MPTGQPSLDAYRAAVEMIMSARQGGNAQPLSHILDAAETLFTQGVEQDDDEKVVEGWNLLVDTTAENAIALRNLGVFLLASVVNHSSITAEEIMAAALEVARTDSAG